MLATVATLRETLSQVYKLGLDQALLTIQLLKKDTCVGYGWWPIFCKPAAPENYFLCLHHVVMLT